MCRCLYYLHPVDRCSLYGKSGHEVQRRTVLVGYACSSHSPSSSANHEPLQRARHRLTKVSSSATASGQGKTQDIPHSTAETEAGNGDTPPNPRKKTLRNLLEWSTLEPLAGMGGLFVSGMIPREPHIELPETPHREEPGSSAAIYSVIESMASFKATGFEADEWITDMSDSSSDRSVPSTATTASIDATEAISQRLLQFQDLKYLWPQLINRSKTWKRSCRTIERFLRRYATDLQELAKSPLPVTSLEVNGDNPQATAARFVHTSRFNLAQRICAAHYQSTGFPSTDISVTSNPGVEVPTLDRAGDRALIEDEELRFIVETAQVFLFETPPIFSLQANVKAFVRLPRKSTTSQIRLTLQSWSEKVFGSLTEPPVPGTTKRIRWTCVRAHSSPPTVH